MKPLRLCAKLSILVLVVVLSYYLGKPVYWEVLDRVQVAASNVPELEAVAQPEDGKGVDFGRKVGSPAEPVKELSKDELVVQEKADELKKNAASTGVVQKGASNASEDVSRLVSTKVEERNRKGGNTQDGGITIVEAAQSEDKVNTVEDADEQSKPGENGEMHFGSYAVLQQPIWTVPAPDSKIPPMESFALSKEMIEFRAEKKVIVVTFANFAFMDFVLNWVKHLTSYEVYNILIGAMDTKILEALFWKGVPVFDMRSHMDTSDVGWGTAKFHKMGREKVILVNAFLSFDHELLMCDTDMVFLQNPLPYFERYPAADVLTSSDEVVNTVDDDKLEVWDRSYGAYNIGIVFWRPTPAAKALAKTWKEQLLADDGIWDQNGFNDLVRNKTGPSVDDSGLFYAFDGELKLGVLPISLFCSGHTYFVQELYKKLDLLPYAVHTTFQFGATEGKRHRLREGKLFYDPPEYYDTPGGYITFKPSIPEELLSGGQHSLETHFALVNFQLIQIRSALAMAAILNRTLIMPPLWCRFDRMWYGFPGVLYGTKTTQPFLCPLDHVFEINSMLKKLPAQEFGPPIDFREYSFLENSRVPSKVKKSKLKVKLCKEGSTGCSRKPNATSAVLKLPKNSTENQLKATFAAYKDYKVIEFSSSVHAFGGFSNKKTEEKFVRRVKTYTGIWCCVMDKIPGHIWYDVYWDTKPHWKPLPPSDPSLDHQPF